MSEHQQPGPDEQRRPAATTNVDHSPTNSEHRSRGRRGTVWGLGAVAAGLVVAGVGLLIGPASTTAAGILILAGLVAVLGGCFVVLASSGSSGPGNPGPGGGFSALGP